MQNSKNGNLCHKWAIMHYKYTLIVLLYTNNEQLFIEKEENHLIDSNNKTTKSLTTEKTDKLKPIKH